MLPRPNRLTSSPEIGQIVRQGQKLHSPLVTLFWRVGVAGQPTRIACVAGKKISASAVVRHRIQRQLRRGAREALSHIPQQYDIVLLARPAAASGIDTAQLVTEVASLARQLKTRQPQ